jgi:uncharacterized protein YegL
MATKTKTRKRAKAKTKTATETIHLGLLIDESGSMGGKEEAVITGCNEFIQGLRADEQVAAKEVRATLAVFDASAGNEVVRVKYEGTPLSEVPELTAADYRPRGMTPLNDAVLEVIGRMERETDEGDKAMLVIFTDGLENASNASNDQVREKISEREAAGWTFIYLGANQDAWAAGGAIGVSAGSSKNFMATRRGTVGTMRAASSMAGLYATTDRGTYDSTMAALGDEIGEDGLSATQAKALADARAKAKGGEGS